MKRWENGEYIELTPAEEAAEAAWRAAAEAEERVRAEREAARTARIAAFRAKARGDRVTLADLVDVALALVGE